MGSLSSSFQACSDFEASLLEVRHLLSLASRKDVAQGARPALLKSSILLLAAKAEGFLESAVEEARFTIESSAVAASDLPPELVIAALQFIVDESFIQQVRSGNIKAIERLKQFTPALTGDAMITLKIDTRFSYGRHGETEIKKMFARVGIGDVFSSIPIESDTENGSASIKADINSLTAIRNNIIHSDASPAFTVEQVEGFVERLTLFARGVHVLLSAHCQALCNIQSQ